MKKFLFDCGTRDATASLAFLVLRICIGLMMLLGHGLPKLMDFQNRKDLFPVPDFFPFSSMGSPVSLVLCIIAEVGASSLIIIGLATRPAAFALGLCMTLAAFGYLGSAPWFLTTPTLVETKELSVMYLIPMIVIIIAGGGAYSMDAAVYKEGKRRRW